MAEATRSGSPVPVTLISFLTIIAMLRIERTRSRQRSRNLLRRASKCAGANAD